MKYLLILIFLINNSCFAQPYSERIAAFRKGYRDDFLKDESSPLKKDDLQFLRFYDADSTYRVTASVEILANEPTFIMPVFSGTGQQYLRYALLTFMIKGKPMELALYKSIALAQNPQYSDYLFMPFTDQTNGAGTYGGGRYIDFRQGDIRNNSVELDFNKAYNPYCAYSGRYSCPKPPGENNLDIAVEAGEKLFAGDKKHLQ